MSIVLEKIAPDIAKLAAEKGMRTVRESYDASSFGNAVVELTSGDFDLRVVRDRGQAAIELSPCGKADWHDVTNVLAFINAESPSDDATGPSRSLAAKYDQVAALLTSDLDRVGFTAFERKRATSFLKSLFPSAP